MPAPVVVPLVADAMSAAAGWGTFHGLHNYYKARVRPPSVVEPRPTENISAAATRAGMRSRVRTYRKRRGRRGLKRYKRRVRGFPAGVVRRVRHVFYQTWNLASASALAGGCVKLNSAYDPAGDFGTGQPLTHDEYSALYRKYQVVGWSVKLEVVTTENTYPLVIGFTPLTTSSLLTTYNHYKEFGQTVSALLTPDSDKITMFARGSVKRYLAPSGNFRSLDDTQALISADPAKMLFGHIWVQPVEAGVDPGNVHVVATVTQLVRYFDRDTVARS